MCRLSDFSPAPPARLVNILYAKGASRRWVAGPFDARTHNLFFWSEERAGVCNFLGARHGCVRRKEEDACKVIRWKGSRFYN